MFIVKVPGINGLGKTNGCEKAGNEILKILKEEIYSSEAGKEINFETLDLEEIHLDNSRVDFSNKLIYKNALETFEAKPKTVFLGGDHSISYSIGKAFLDYCKNKKKKPCLIIFDAHPDLMEPMKEPTHEEWLRALVDAGFPSESILLVGSRNAYIDELKFIKEKKIKTMSLNQFLLDIEDACDTLMEFANGKELYFSLDIDVVDPIFAPATGYKNEVGGLTSRQLIYLVQRINKMKNLRGVDIVEINPENDVDGRTVKLGAKILAEFL